MLNIKQFGNKTGRWYVCSMSRNFSDTQSILIPTFSLTIYVHIQRLSRGTYLCWSAQRPDFCRPRRKGPPNSVQWPSLEANRPAFEPASRSSFSVRPGWRRWWARARRPRRSSSRVTEWTRRVPEYLWTKRALLSCKYVDAKLFRSCGHWKIGDYTETRDNPF